MSANSWNFLKLLLILSLLDGCSSQWCVERVKVTKTRTRWNSGERLVTTNSWFGFRRTKWQPYQYTSTEAYDDYEKRAVCCEGFVRRSKYVCEPLCPAGCPPNSKCERPNECQCLPGHTRSEGGRCEPICAAGCPPHSHCSAPNVCSCSEGYQPHHATARSSAAKCEPVCSRGCPESGLCVAPEQCSCLPGHTLRRVRAQANSTEERERCVPQCRNGCPANSRCTAPEFCECLPGHRRTPIGACEPVCEPACGANVAKCVAPNVCECLAGYASTNSSDHACRPVCSRGCENGLCFAPEVCICDAGYRMGPQERCEPVCSMDCVHGTCEEPEICVCQAGYRLRPNSVSICEPICEAGCVNGNCAVGLGDDGSFGGTRQRCQPDRATTEVSSTLTDLESEETGTEAPNGSEEATATETSDPPPTLLLRDDLARAALCQNLCQCWQEYDELGSLSTVPCLGVCRDGHQAPCLDPEKCLCNLGRQQLLCTDPDADSSAEDAQTVYTCRTAADPATSTPLPAENRSHSERPPDDHLRTWLWVAAAIGGLGLAGLLVAGYIVRTRRKSDDYTVRYENCVGH